MRRRYVRRDVADDEEALRDATGAGGASRGFARQALSVLGVVATIIVTIMVVNNLSEHPDASAVQVTQVYVEGLFWEAIVVGVMVAVYIGTQADE